MSGASGLHARLRAATAPAHAALERDLDWTTRIATLEGYRTLLALMYGFHATWETAIGAALADDAFFGPRRRLDLLGGDLHDLGLTQATIAALPRPLPPSFVGTAAMGALYVLEGSTLGGRVIARTVAKLHGADMPCGYYRAHGTAGCRMWASFCTRLDAMPEGDGSDAVATAVETFEALRDWLAGASYPPDHHRRTPAPSLR